jgi:hypothetical protein
MLPSLQDGAGMHGAWSSQFEDVDERQPLASPDIVGDSSTLTPYGGVPTHGAYLWTGYDWLFVAFPVNSSDGAAPTNHNCVEDSAGSGSSGSSSVPTGTRPTPSAQRRLRRKKAELLKSGSNTTGAVQHKCESQTMDRVSVARHQEAMQSWCSGLEAKVKAGGQAKAEAIGEMGRSLAFDPFGCHVVQLALEEGTKKEKESLVMLLHGCVCAATTSPHANYVIQKVVVLMAAGPSIRFVAQELKGRAFHMACHRYGCRVLQRLVEHATRDAATVELIDEMLLQSNVLCTHQYGHHVLTCILEQGLPQHKRIIAASLSAQPKNANVSRILEAALRSCETADQPMLGLALANQPQALVCMAKNKSSCHLIRKAVQIQGESSQAVRRVLQQVAGQVEMSTCGTALLEELQITGAGAEVKISGLPLQQVRKLQEDEENTMPTA